MGVNWQAYKKSQNSTWADNEERPFNVQEIKGEKPWEGLFPKDSKRKEGMLKDVN